MSTVLSAIGRPIGSVYSDVTDAESAAGVTPVDTAIAPYVRGRYASFSDWRLACNQVSAEGSLDADYAITADTELPKKSDFCGFQITGAFKTYHTDYQGGHVHSWVAEFPSVRGCYDCEYTGIRSPNAAGTLLLEGHTLGIFWCKFFIEAVRNLVVSCNTGQINQNTVYAGVARYVHITGGGGGSGAAHANWFIGCDVSPNGDGQPNGFLQDDTSRYVNYIAQAYYDAGADIEGNFHVMNFQADESSPPRVDRFAHIWGAVGVNQKASRDFPSIGIVNAALGGDWSVLDGNGIPPSFSNVGGASVSVQTDTTEPAGCGKRYQADFADAFDSFIVTLQPTGSDRFGAVIFYKATADFVAIESNDGSGTLSHNARPVTVDSTNNWKMFRLAGAASKTATTSLRLYGYAASGGATKTMSLGGVFAAGERAVVPPQKQLRTTRYGSAVYDPPSLNDGAGTTTTVTVTGAALGDFARASFSLDIQGITLTAWVSSSNTVSVRLQNESGGVLDLSSGTLRVETKAPLA